MELKRFIVVSADPQADVEFLGNLGLTPRAGGSQWMALGLEGASDPPVELLAEPPMSGFSVAPGFQVED